MHVYLARNEREQMGTEVVARRTGSWDVSKTGRRLSGKSTGSGASPWMQRES